mgnify:CR=1 FL=1|tara:strand:+ start:274 stop:1074 length:801 start_codon:yes stop_codon:yes gene_type:complete
MIYKFRNDGLTSRLRHIWQIPFVYSLYKKHINVVWRQTDECNIALGKIIKPKKFYSIQDSCEDLPVSFFGAKVNEEIFDITKIEKMLKREDDPQYPHWRLTEYYSEIFDPTDEVVNEFNKIKLKYNISSDVIGVHLRGFEPTESGGGSRGRTKQIIQKDISDRFKEINKILSNKKDQRFLIASDDIEIENTFISKFPDNFFNVKEDKKPSNTKGIALSNRNEESIIKSFVLLLILSETNYKFATNGSFFTRFPPIIQKIREFKEFL